MLGWVPSMIPRLARSGHDGGAAQPTQGRRGKSISTPPNQTCGHRGYPPGAHLQSHLAYADPRLHYTEWCAAGVGPRERVSQYVDQATFCASLRHGWWRHPARPCSVDASGLQHINSWLTCRLCGVLSDLLHVAGGSRVDERPQRQAETLHRGVLMTPHRWPLALCLSAVVFNLGCASRGQTEGAEPGPALGDMLPEWATESWLEDRQTGDGSYILVRNNTSEAVVVESLYLTDCVNIRTSCNTRLRVHQQLARGGEARIWLVHPNFIDRAWSFRYRYTVHSVRPPQ